MLERESPVIAMTSRMRMIRPWLERTEVCTAIPISCDVFKNSPASWGRTSAGYPRFPPLSPLGDLPGNSIMHCVTWDGAGKQLRPRLMVRDDRYLPRSVHDGFRHVAARRPLPPRRGSPPNAASSRAALRGSSPGRKRFPACPSARVRAGGRLPRAGSPAIPSRCSWQASGGRARSCRPCTPSARAPSARCCCSLGAVGHTCWETARCRRP